MLTQTNSFSLLGVLISMSILVKIDQKCDRESAQTDTQADWQTLTDFYRAACIAARSSHEKAVCPSLCLSVCLSVCQTPDVWQNEKELCPHSYTIWKIIYPSFMTKRMVGGGDPFSLKFWVILPRWSENADFQSIFACSASAVTPSKKFN